MSSKPKNRGKSKRGFRRVARHGGIALLLFFAFYASLAVWFVHHSNEWISEKTSSWPNSFVEPLLSVGYRLGDVTDALGWTGADVVYEYDMAAPNGATLFAGAPIRTGGSSPDDIDVLDRGEFKIGWSAKLHHPVWCAYHVAKDAKFPSSRKNFQRDRSVPSAPTPDDYKGSGYDRGHMAPNHAIVTRYGEEAQRKTFLMSNIVPQSSQLNRGVWRDFEHRIAELWTARYGEIWVIVGCIPSSSKKSFGGLRVDVPDAFYQIVLAQEGLDIRALAVVFPQSVPYDAYAVHYLTSIDEIEELTGLDFLPDLPSFIQDPLEAGVPTRLWPIRVQDIFKLIGLRFEY